MQAALGDSKRARRAGGREGGKEGVTGHGTRLVERDASSCLRVCTRTDNRPAAPRLSSEALEDPPDSHALAARASPSRSEARRSKARSIHVLVQYCVKQLVKLEEHSFSVYRYVYSSKYNYSSSGGGGGTS